VVQDHSLFHPLVVVVSPFLPLLPALLADAVSPFLPLPVLLVVVVSLQAPDLLVVVASPFLPLPPDLDLPVEVRLYLVAGEFLCHKVRPNLDPEEEEEV